MIKLTVVCCVFILIDILSGIAKASKSKELSSSVMREGLYHKIAELFLLGLAVFCHWTLSMEPFNSIGIPAEIMYVVCGYIAVMEIVSIIENICLMNPDIPLAKVLSFFNIDNKLSKK